MQMALNVVRKLKYLQLDHMECFLNLTRKNHVLTYIIFTLDYLDYFDSLVGVNSQVR